MSQLDLVDFSDVRVPGGELAQSPISVVLSPEQRLSRLTISLREPLFLNPDSTFNFSIKYADPSQVHFDILKGDVGFPEIHLTTIEGETYSFKRGNIKDFFSLAKMDDFQLLKLPIGAFSYNTHMKTNHPETGRFFETQIKDICLDFLHSPSASIAATIDTVQIEELAPSLPSCFSFLNISPGWKLPCQPSMTTEAGVIMLQISAKALISLLPGRNITLVIKDHHSGEQVASMPMQNTTSYCKLKTAKLGEHQFEAILLSDGTPVARNLFTAVRVLPMAERSKSKMGLSDGASFGEVSSAGGQFIRRVFALSNLSQNSHGFGFKPDLMLNHTTRSAHQDWLISLKYMPPFLQKDLPQAHRLAPGDMGAYRQMLQWLLPKLAQAGIWTIESWNEANVIHEWCDSYEALCEMQRCLYETAKSISVSFNILSPSSTSWDFDYFNKLIDAGVMQYCDGLAAHGYSYTPQNAHAYFDRMEACLNRCPTQVKGIYLTEVGFRTPAYTNFEQASYLALFTLESFFREKVKAVLWFRYKNPRPESFSTYDQSASTGYAMVGYGGLYARAALATYRFLDRLLSRVTPHGIVEIGNALAFTGIIDNAIPITAVYSEKGLPVDFRRVGVIYDIFGNRLSRDDLPQQKVVFFCDDPITP